MEHRMYSLINNNINLLLDGINEKDHITPYISISESFNKNQSNNLEFKMLYRKYYQLNAARLSEDFCESYFSLLEENRTNDTIDIVDITNRLYELKSNSRGIHSVHFSFASKLVHTVNNVLPIYDSRVAEFYFFPNIKPKWDKDRKTQEYLASYHFLREEYDRIIEDKLLELSIAEFRKKFTTVEKYSDVKLIDTILWRYTAFLKSGAVRDGEIQYSPA